jgi:hypothetical protein
MAMTDSEPAKIDAAGLLQLHIVEYNALANRVTYFILAQYSLLPLLVAASGIGAEISQHISNPKLVFWGLLLVAQVLGIYFQVSEAENYKIIAYIESRLRPELTILMGTSSFWGYEQKLKAPRTPLWEIPIVVGTLLLIVITCITIWPHTRGEFIGLSLNIIVYLAVFWSFREMTRARNNI